MGLNLRKGDEFNALESFAAGDDAEDVDPTAIIAYEAVKKQKDGWLCRAIHHHYQDLVFIPDEAEYQMYCLEAPDGELIDVRYLNTDDPQKILGGLGTDTRILCGSKFRGGEIRVIESA